MSPINQMEVCLVMCVEPQPSNVRIETGSFKQELVALRPNAAVISRAATSTAATTTATNIEQYFWRIKCGESSNSLDLIREFNLLNDLKKASQQSIVAPTKCANFSTGVDSFFLFDLARSISDYPEFLGAAEISLKLQCLHSTLLALKAIHNIAMVHVHLVPDNILIVTNPVTKVIRFQLQCFTFLRSDETNPVNQQAQHADYSHTEMDEDDDIYSESSTMLPDSNTLYWFNDISTILSRQLHLFSAPESRDNFSRNAQRNSNAQNVFSFGCIAFYILCNGGLPFSTSASWNDSVYQKSYETPEIYISQLKASLLAAFGHNQTPMHRSFVDLIANSLMPNPTSRPSLSTLLSHPLFI